MQHGEQCFECLKAQQASGMLGQIESLRRRLWGFTFPIGHSGGRVCDVCVSVYILHPYMISVMHVSVTGLKSIHIRLTMWISLVVSVLSTL